MKINYKLYQIISCMDAPESSHVRNAGRVNPRVQAGGGGDSALVVQGVAVQGRSG